MSNRRRWFAAALVIWAGAGAAGSIRAATWDCRLAPKETFTTAEFRLWVDDAVPLSRPLTTLLVLAPGWNGDGRPLAQSGEWQAFAREMNAGIVGVHFESEAKEDAPNYHHLDKGSGAAWLRALADLGRQSRRAELASVPWLLWGHSAGGQFGYGLACVYPDRVAAFVATKGGVYETTFNPTARGVPGLFIIGEYDEPGRAMRITELFERERRENAAWAIAWETGAGHEVGQSLPLARAFLRESLALRIDGSGKLRRLRAGQGWLGNRASYTEVKSWPTTPEERVRTAWLPGPESGSAWRQLGHTGLDDEGESK